MDFYEVINSRRTIRDFTGEAIDADTITRILSAGLKAPSNDHLRNWEFVTITDKDLVAKLIKPIPKTMSEKRLDFITKSWKLNDPCQKDMYYVAIPKQYKMLLNAGCLVVPLYKQHKDLLKPQNLSSLNSFASIWCCIENIFLAATAENLACTLRIPLGEEANHAAEIIGFPKDYVMPCYIAIGKPAEDAFISTQKECRIEEKIHINHW